ncbi:MAG: efflux RND transporter periplasmic adaptor subunit, partial [Clostridiales bacterium]|nr:efflux RND transporter periplasmic adaptor subunit [Clostridiales bacterium]
ATDPEEPTYPDQDSGDDSGDTDTDADSSTTTTALRYRLLMQLQYVEGTGYCFQLISMENDTTGDLVFRWDNEPLPALPEDEEDTGTPAQTFVDGIKYTATELAEMVQAAESQVKDLDIQLRQAKLEYEKAEQELNNGAIYATLSGEVKDLISEDEALTSGSALMRVSAGGGFYIQASCSELMLSEVQVGQTVSVYDYYNGAECEGTVTEISEYPTTSGYYWGDGNSNISLYPFTVYVDEDGGLEQGDYAEITYSSAESGGSGFYLESMFIRRENGRSYVYTVAEDGTLEKRYISTGRSLWGSYTQVTGGLSLDERVSFPYGDGTEEGAHTAEASVDEFYGW